MIGILLLIVILIVAGATSKVLINGQSMKADSNRFFSVRSMTEKVTILLQRFPVGLTLIVSLTFFMMLSIENKTFEEIYRIVIFFSVGSAIATASIVFLEDYLNAIRANITALVIIILWGLYCYLLPVKADDLEVGKWIELTVISTSSFLSILFVPYLKKNKDREFWNYVTQTLFQLALASVFASIIFGGLSLALLAIQSLFGIDVNEKLYGHLMVLCYIFFSPIYFLANIPNKQEKQIVEIFHSKVQKTLALYILTPVLAVYAAILYAYFLKIIFVWELPKGWVTWLVSTLALGGLVVISFLYPVRERDQTKVVDFITRWFGVIILPLLILMTIGIIRRISDYGISINRIYILLLNLWFYGIYFYLFLTNSRHIKWILISPVIIALLSSISLWGVSSITKKSLLNDLHNTLSQPMTIDEARIIFREMPKSDKEKIIGKIEYLHQVYGEEVVQSFFTDNILRSPKSLSTKLGLNDDEEFVSEAISYFYPSQKTWNTNGFQNFTRIDYYEHRVKSHTINTRNSDIIELKADEKLFKVSMRNSILEHLSTSENLRNEREWIVQGENFQLIINSLYANYYLENDSIYIRSLNGFLFFNNEL
ncbi:MAG: DUF4153 domain-containing protein [Flavobacteriales bacterium]|nr:MAG: DUF4153 domain-containing protein [Flavobacteriales bacterium]